MTSNTARTILMDMVDTKITTIKAKCKRNKRFFQFFTAGSIILSASITVVVGLEWPNHAAIQKNIALIMGVSLTLINGWVAIFDFKKLWMRQKNTLFGLYLIDNELKILTDSDEDKLRVKELFNAYQAVWEKDGSEWANIFSSDIESSKITQNIKELQS